MKKFCCQADRKLWEVTDPDAPISMNWCGTCAICGGPEPYTYHVPESIWRYILPEKYWKEVVCAKCFHNLALAKHNKAEEELFCKRAKDRTNHGKN